MRINFCVCLFIVFMFLMIGCEEEKESVIKKTTILEKINLEVGTTVGNHTYLPVNIYGVPADHVQEILQILFAFEKEHPELEITSWSIEKQPDVYARDPYIFGIWLNHRPKN